MSNIANTTNALIETAEDKRVEEISQSIIGLSALLANAVLTRPRCGCERSLCSTCRRDKAEIELAEKLRNTLCEIGIETGDN